MVFRNSFSVTFIALSISALLLITSNGVNGECSCDDDDHMTEHGKLSEFIHKVGCGLKEGAKIVKNTVQDGYKFVKNKVTSKSKTIDENVTQNPDGRDPDLIYPIDVRSGTGAR